MMLILKVSFATYHHIKDSFSIASQRDAEDFVTSAVKTLFLYTGKTSSPTRKCFLITL